METGEYYSRFDGGSQVGPAFRVESPTKLRATTTLTGWVLSVNEDDGRWGGPLTESTVEHIERDQLMRGGQ